jgi:ubiquitin carboxyl-terminal hydrolase 7
VRVAWPWLILVGLLADAKHRFVPDEPDWGYTRFAESTAVYNRQDGQAQSRPLVENNCTEVTVFVRVMRDPTGLLWHDLGT